MAVKTNGGLGRGLDSIFLDNTTPENGGGTSLVRISQIEPRRDQPRKNFDLEALQQLADSISAHGVIQPVAVRESIGGYYEIIAGERRWRAAKMAGLSEIPVTVIAADDKKAAELALIENVQREDLNPIEEALAYKKLSEEYGLTQEKVAQAVGKSRSGVANSLRLLDLPETVLFCIPDQRGTLPCSFFGLLVRCAKSAPLPPFRTPLRLYCSYRSSRWADRGWVLR